MQPVHYSMLLHFVGIGLIFTTLFAGWILNAQYLKSSDFKTKSQILKLMKPIGLLSPAAIVVMILSGIGNMTLGHMNYDLTSDGWLTRKIGLFVLAAALGIIFGIRSGKRGRLVQQVAEKSAPAGTSEKITAMDAQYRVFMVVQLVLILLILTLSIVKMR